MIKPHVIHKDGTLWEAGYKTTQDAMRAMFDRSAPQFYFRQVKHNGERRWWSWCSPRFVYTGEVWEGSDMRGAGFIVIPETR